MISPGSYLNTTGNGGKRCSWAEKHNYLRLSKFTIAGDSISYPGFVTEKIVDPFVFHSIPVYYGNPRIYEDFNREAFVCCESENGIDCVIEEVKRLDSDDEAYIDMLMKCQFPSEDHLERLYADVESFLVNVFSQDKKSAFRRIRYFCAEQHESYLRDYMKKQERTPEIIKRVKSKLKR